MPPFRRGRNVAQLQRRLQLMRPTWSMAWGGRTLVRAQACAAGATKNGGQAEQVLGRSRGGFSTQIHVTWR